MKLIDIICAAALFAAAQMPAQAFAETAGPSMAVSTSGLDLTDPNDAERLLARIEHAARAVCEDSFSRRSTMLGQAYRACRADTVADAVSRMDAPMLTGAYEAQYGAAPVLLAMR